MTIVTTGTFLHPSVRYNLPGECADEPDAGTPNSPPQSLWCGLAAYSCGNHVVTGPRLDAPTAGPGPVLAPGARVVLRDAEWVIRRVDRSPDGGYQFVCNGVSELVREARGDLPDDPRTGHPGTGSRRNPPRAGRVARLRGQSALPGEPAPAGGPERRARSRCPTERRWIR